MTDYDVKIVAYDLNDHSVELEKNVKGILCGLIAAFLDLMGDIFGAILDAVAALMSFIIDAIVSMIKKVVNKVLEPILNAIDNWKTNMQKTLDSIFGSSQGGSRSIFTDKATDNAGALIFNALIFGGLVSCIGMLILTMRVVTGITDIYTVSGLGILIGIVFSLLMPMIIQAIIGVSDDESGVAETNNKNVKQNYDVDAFSGMLDKFKNILWEADAILTVIEVSMIAYWYFKLHLDAKAWGGWLSGDGRGVIFTALGTMFLFLDGYPAARAGLFFALFGFMLTLPKDMGDKTAAVTQNKLHLWEEILCFIALMVEGFQVIEEYGDWDLSWDDFI